MPTDDAASRPAPDPTPDAAAHAAADSRIDPTRQRDQPALTTSTGLVWLVVGGILAVVSLAVLVPMAGLPNGAVAVAAAVIIVVLYVGMVVARLALPPGRRRLGLMATAMLLIAGVALLATVLVAFSTAGSVGGAPG